MARHKAATSGDDKADPVSVVGKARKLLDRELALNVKKLTFCSV